MKPVHFLFRITVLGFLAVLAGSGITSTAAPDLLDHDVRRLGSDDVVNLKDTYGGKVVLVVNTASRCAFTKQYAGLEALYAKYRDKGLVVLGFPSNDFGNQEPGSEKQIQNFCRLTYGVKFPMFAKAKVTEGSADPFFAALGEAAGRYPAWNFHKYLIGRNGQLVENYLSLVSPDSSALVRDIEALL